MSKYVFARITGTVQGRAGTLRVREGSVWYADHPLVKEHPDLFSVDPPEVFPRGWTPPEPKVDRVVEQATAAPGEKRGVKRTNA